jgi:hypothetical protein
MTMAKDNSIFSPRKNISILFDEKENVYDAEARKSILRWFVESFRKGQPIEEFRFTELGNWLVINHRQFREEFDSHTKKSYRLTKKRTFIQSRLEELIELGLVEEKGTVKAEKTKESISLYSFTQFGKIFAWLLDAKETTEDKNIRSHAMEIFFRELSTYVNTNYGASSFVDLFTNFFKQCIEEGVHNGISNDYLEFFINLLPPTISSTFRGFLPQQFLRFLRQLLMVGLYTNQDCARIFLELIEESDEQTKELILLQLKLDIESYYHDALGPNLEWEKDRRKYIGDPYNIVVQGYCLECKLKTVYVLGLQNFLYELSGIGVIPSSADSKGEKPVRRDLPLPEIQDRAVSIRYMTYSNQYCNIKYNPNASGIIPILYIPPQYLDTRGFSPEYIEEIYDLLKVKGATMADLIVKSDDKE